LEGLRKGIGETTAALHLRRLLGARIGTCRMPAQPVDPVGDSSSVANSRANDSTSSQSVYS